MANFLSQLFGDTPSRIEQVPRFEPQQQQAMMDLLGLAQQQLPQRLQADAFAPIARQARTGFAQSTVPSLAERFTALNGQQSSGFAQALGQAGAGLEGNLAAQEAQFNQQNIAPLLQLLSLGLQPQQEPYLLQGRPGFGSSLAAGAAPFAGMALGSLLPGTGGGLGALLSLLGGR